MTQDEIIEMAQECRLIGMRPHLDGIYSEALVAFAKRVEEKALAEHAMREVQRIGQEIEQEPVAIKRMKEWVEYLKRKSDFGQHMKIPSEMSAGTCWELAIELEQFINTTPPQRKPLTDEQIEQLEQDTCAMEFPETVRAIEAAHGIKENT